MAYRWLALAICGVHFGYLIYLVTGGYLAWRWPRSLPAHLLAVGWGALVIAVNVPCPLTALQNALRARGGESRLSGSFLDTYVRGVFYPSGHEHLVQAVLGVVILVSWLGVFARGRRDRSTIAVG
jgi:hypothetical protein